MERPADRKLTIDALVARWAQSDPAAAFDWALENVPDHLEKYSALTEVVKVLASSPQIS